MEGFDRCIVLSAQALTALIPLFIVVASAAPAGQEDLISQAIIRRLALTGDSADAVALLFMTPAGASSSVTIFSAFLLVFSGVSFSRRLQAMYLAAWGQQRAGLRSSLFAALGLTVLVIAVIAAYLVRGLAARFPLEWLWTIPISLGTGLVLWTALPYLLLERQVHWRRLLVTGGASAIGMTGFAIATPFYMPDLMTRSTSDFGLFGITITLIGWLLVAAGVLVSSAAIGAECDASEGTWLVRLRNRFELSDPGADQSAMKSTPDPAGLTAADLVALVHVLVNWAIMVVAVWVATLVVPGLEVRGGVGTYLTVSLLFGLVNAVLGPLLQWWAGFQSWTRMGGSALLMNGVLFAATAGVSPNLDIAGPSSAVLGALTVAVAATLLELVIRPVP